MGDIKSHFLHFKSSVKKKKQNRKLLFTAIIVYQREIIQYKVGVPPSSGPLKWSNFCGTNCIANLYPSD